ncbi:hypothetical protein E8E11_009763 [Didymella keratinophila]|nr:hypothetical protein E8E11_009763 [Didymella keratinophila]
MSQPLSAPTPELGSLPIELIEMILNSTEADGELILSRSDIRTLRLMNRTLQAASFETFAKQHFTIRKHMLDRRSLDMLLNIAKHPVFSTYVREVAIGPERINAMYIEDDDDLRPDDDPRCSDGLINSHRDPSTVARFRELVSAQENFDADCDSASEYAMTLGQALKTFSNLQTIRLDTYMDMEDDEHRPKAWGARPYYEMASELEKTCFQKINPAYIGTDISSIATDDPNFMPPPHILVYRGLDVECMYMDYELVLHALHHIKDNPDRDLEVHYDFTLRRWPQSMKCDELLHLATIDVESPVWQI